MHCSSLRFPPQERNISHVLGVGNEKSGNRRKSRSVQIRWTLDRLAVATVALLGATNTIWGGGETVAGKRGTFISICRAAGATGRRRGNRRKNTFFRLLHTRPPPLCPGKTGIHSKRGGWANTAQTREHTPSTVSVCRREQCCAVARGKRGNASSSLPPSVAGLWSPSSSFPKEEKEKGQVGKRETGSGEGRGGREAEADCGGDGGWQWRCQWLPFVRQFDEWMLLVAEGRGGELFGVV